MQAEEVPGSVLLLIHNRNLNQAEEGIMIKSKIKTLLRSGYRKVLPRNAGMILLLLVNRLPGSVEFDALWRRQDGPKHSCPQPTLANDKTTSRAEF